MAYRIFSRIATAASAAVLALGAGVGMAPAAAAADFTIKLAHEAPPTHPKGLWADDFAKALEELSGGRIDVQVFPQKQLYKSPQAAMEATVQGLIQMAIPSTGYMSTLVPEYEVVDLPMIFDSQEALYAFEDGPVGQDLLARIESKGLKGLGWVSNAPLDLFGKTKMVEPADFAGKKVRAHSAVLEETVRALGGNPVSMPAAELYLALQQGIVDGAFTTVTYAAPNKYHEVTPFLTRAGVSSIAYPVAMNLRFWQGLPADLQQAVTDAVARASEQNRKSLAEQEAKAIETLSAGGITVVELTPEQRQQWRERLKAVYDRLEKSVGADFIARVQSAGS